MMKTKQDNDVTDRIDMFYVKTKTKLLGLIWPSAVYAKKILKCRDQLD